MNGVAATLINVVSEVWLVTTRMAPYLLLGFLMAGVLSVLISPATVERHLGRKGWRQVMKAALFGVPIPLCSCGVIPVATALHRHGASRGATLSFLASTPQTGVDSILVTQGMLGGVFTIFRVGVAFVSGLLCGTLDEFFDREIETTAPSCADECCGAATDRPAWIRMLHYGFVVLPRDISGAVFFGIIASGILSALVPENFFAGRLPPGLPSMLMMMVLGIPLYSCSTGSVPLTLALIHLGISPGAAFVFLVTGPATNAATVTTLWRVLGRRAAAIYLAAIAVCALAGGWAMDRLIHPEDLPQLADGMAHGASWWMGVASAILLVGVLAVAMLGGVFKKRAS